MVWAEELAGGASLAWCETRGCLGEPDWVAGTRATVRVSCHTHTPVPLLCEFLTLRDLVGHCECRRPDPCSYPVSELLFSAGTESSWLSLQVDAGSAPGKLSSSEALASLGWLEQASLTQVDPAGVSQSRASAGMEKTARATGTGQL